MPTREWFCQVCGNMNGHGMTAIPSSCMRCGLSHTARAYPAFDPRTGKVVDAQSFAAPIAATNYVHIGRWSRCLHCHVVHLGMDPNSHFCGAPWQTPASDMPADWVLAARSPAPSDKPDEYDEASAVALQVLCRVFEDGADVAMEEWREWYKPEQWLWHARGLGAFIASRLAEKRELTADERGAFERLQAAMHIVSGKSKPVEITMRDANCLVHAIASPPRAANSPIEFICGNPDCECAQRQFGMCPGNSTESTHSTATTITTT